MYNQGKIMRKLLGKPTSADSPNEGGLSITSSPHVIAPVYRPSASQNAVYNAGAPIKCIDTTPDHSLAVLGGPYVLKTVKIDGTHIKEGIDLRSLITAHTTSKPGAASSTSDQLAIRDVKLATGQTSQGSPTIFTACANGKIFQYDLARAGSSAAGGSGLEFIQIREDARQINSLDVNPHRGSILLSGSQDGIARCFDTRTPIQTRTGLTFRSISPHPFRCNADSVRQVKWSPTEGLYFACSTDQGVVLKWDIRKHTAPILKIKAHDKICTSIAWHPDGEHLVSGGWDGKCHVWDVSKNADKRQKAKWSISTPAPVSVVVWRPGQWSATAQGKRAAQIAVSYDDSSQKRHGINTVHIWDMARPTMPYKEIQRFDSLPSALLWHDRDLLWTAGQDGLFNQCDIAFAPKVIDRQTVSTMAFSARGDVLMFVDERQESHRPRTHVIAKDLLPRSSYGSSPSTPMLSISRSDSEEDIVGSFLGPRRRGTRRRRLSTRSAHALSSTPPGGPGSDENPLTLEQAINLTGIYKSQQARVFGHVPAAADVDLYGYLATNYLQTLYDELPYTRGGKAMTERIAIILDRYAKAAESISQFRLAQSWRILAYGMNMLLKRRAQFHLEQRMRPKIGRKKSIPHPEHVSLLEVPHDPTDGEDTPRRVRSTGSLDKPGYARSLLSEEIESTSNVPTPLARPVRDLGDDDRRHLDRPGHHYGKNLAPVLEPDDFSLPPAVHQMTKDRARLDSVPLSVNSHDSERTDDSHASLEGYDFYDTAALAKAIDVPAPKGKESSKPPDHLEMGSYAKRNPVLRHDSEESFSQMFSVSDSSRHDTGMGGSSGASMSRRPKLATNPRRTVERSESNASEAEFESRIRGEKVGYSPVRSRSALHLTLDRTETGMTGFTDEHHMITQTTSDSFTSQLDGPSDQAFSTSSPEKRFYRPRQEDSFTSEDQRSPYVIEEDYLHWLDDPPYPHPLESDDDGFYSMNRNPPIQPYTLVARALAFECRSSALNASAMILLLKPLLPPDVIDDFQAAAILRQHHARLMSLKLFVEAALLRKVCLRGWPGGVLSSWGEDYPAIATPATQGVQVGFFCANCHKAREIDRTAASTQSVWRCDRCKSAMAPCAVCGHRDTTPNLDPATPPSYYFPDPQRASGSAAPILSTWWYCYTCGHGGHSTCLQGWHGPAFDAEHHHHTSGFDTPPDLSDCAEFSDGCCPVDGCGHACLPGRWRNETAAQRTEEVSRAVREVNRATAAAASATSGRSPAAGLSPSGGGGFGFGGGGSEHHRRANTFSEFGVRGDAHEVVQSRAVESVRETLAAEGQQHGKDGSGAKGGVLSSSPGRGGSFMPEKTGGERERRKSVKFVASTEGGT
jgi:WD40 repeat protein